ncbi:hypothetical protein FACS189450_15320 [Spirochaetia bacterium]|nr:hypothetical protein FACS189450_15320 [Spirochaetia bacterium]
MDRRELLRKITSFPITASGLAEDLLAGDYRSVFKGQGIEFDEARHYEIGDDVRSIDWNASARFGTPYVKMYREERELTVFIILDTSASMTSGASAPFQSFQSESGPKGRMHTGGASGNSGTVNRAISNRFEQGSFAAALVAFSAEEAGQRVGALFLIGRSPGFFRRKRAGGIIWAFWETPRQFRPAIAEVHWGRPWPGQGGSSSGEVSWW